MTPLLKVALLIDGDNVPLRHAQTIIEWCQQYGNLKIKRAYGDWEKLPLAPYREKIVTWGIDAVQQSRVGVNATDFALAMDLALMLDKNQAKIYCIASSDRDFVAVCDRIAQKGAKAVVIGEKHKIAKNFKPIAEFVDLETILKKDQ